MVASGRSEMRTMPACPGLGRHDLQPASVQLHDLAGDRQPEPQADNTRREEGRCGLLRGFRREAAAVVLDLDLQATQAVAGGFLVQPHPDPGVTGVSPWSPLRITSVSAYLSAGRLPESTMGLLGESHLNGAGLLGW